MAKARCKKCLDILELFDDSKDIFYCKCGEISIHCANKKIVCSTPESLEMIDDKGNVIVSDSPPQAGDKPTKKDLLSELDMMIKNFTDLPDHVMMTPISHYDFVSSLILVSALLRLEDRV